MRLTIFLCIFCVSLSAGAESAELDSGVVYLQVRPVIDGEARGEPMVGTRMMKPASMVFHEGGKDWTTRFVVIHADDRRARFLVDVDRGEEHVAATIVETDLRTPTEVSFEDGGHRIAMEVVVRRERN